MNLPVRALAAAVLLIAMSSSTLAEDCSTCTRDKLCEPHAVSYKAAGDNMVKAARNGNAEARKEAILAFGRECAAHSNSRPLTYIKTLLYFLEDMDLGVLAAAATTMGETQAPAMAGPYLGSAATGLLKQLEALKPADTKAREEKLARLEILAEGLVATGESGGSAIAAFLASADPEVMALGAVRCRKTRGAQMPKVVLEAIERCRTLPASGKRDQVCQDLVVSWEELTKSGIKSPISDARDPAEMDRWIGEAKKWIGQYLKTWK